MKVSNFCTALALFAGLSAAPALNAEAGTLPEAEIDGSTLGGHMLLIRMKQFLVVSGAENEAVLAELGKRGRQDFYHEIVRDFAPEAIAASRNIAPGSAAGRILSRYRAIRDQLPGSRPN